MVVSRPGPDERAPLITAHQPAAESRAGAGAGARYGATTTPEENVPDAPLPPKEVAESPPWTVLLPILASIWAAVFMGALDGTIVATLLSSISSSFDASNMSSWLGSSYLLSVCCFTPIYGRLSDIIGRKGAMLVALGFFMVGTLACALAPTMNMLIAARAFAGIGGGGVMTCSSIIVTDLIPLRKRGLYQGCANILFGAGAGLGGPLGGFLNDTLGWRFAFLIQIPFLAVAFACIAYFVNIPLAQSRGSFREKLARIDYLGSLTLVLAVSSLLLSLSFLSASDLPLSHPLVWGLLLSFAFWTAIFVFVEIKIAKEPVMPLRLLKMRTPLFVALSNLTVSVASFSTLYNYPLFFQAVKLQSASEAGLHLIPNSIALSAGSVIAGIVMRRTGRYWVFNIVCAILPVLSTAYIAAWTEGTSTWGQYLGIVPCGFGVSGVITTTLVALISAVDRTDLAVATGVSYLFRTTGQVLGVAVSGSVLQSLLTSQLRERITGPGAEEIISSIRHNASLIPTLSPPIRRAAVESYSIALRAVFVGVTVVNLATVLFCAPIEELELDGKKTATAGQAGQVGVEHEHEREGRAGQRGECETGR